MNVKADNLTFHVLLFIRNVGGEKYGLDHLTFDLLNRILGLKIKQYQDKRTPPPIVVS